MTLHNGKFHDARLPSIVNIHRSSYDQQAGACMPFIGDKWAKGTVSFRANTSPSLDLAGVGPRILIA